MLTYGQMRAQVDFDKRFYRGDAYFCFKCSWFYFGYYDHKNQNITLLLKFTLMTKCNPRNTYKIRNLFKNKNQRVIKINQFVILFLVNSCTKSFVDLVTELHIGN